MNKRSLLLRSVLPGSESGWLVFAALLISLGGVSVAGAEAIAGRASVIDADTIEIHGQRIRLHGVDAPEKGQECFLPDGSPWRCGQKGALALADFIGESPVSCQPVDADRYGRIIANCRARGRDIEEWLVSEGWAMAYRRYSTDYVGAEQAAKNAKRGIWAGTVQPPWEWRREKRNHYSSPPSP